MHLYSVFWSDGAIWRGREIAQNWRNIYRCVWHYDGWVWGWRSVRLLRIRNMNIRCKNWFGYGQRLYWINFHILTQWIRLAIATEKRRVKERHAIYLLEQFPMISINILFSIGLRNANRMHIDGTQKERVCVRALFVWIFYAGQFVLAIWTGPMAWKGQMDNTNFNIKFIFQYFVSLQIVLFRSSQCVTSSYVLTILARLFIKYGKQLNFDINLFLLRSELTNLFLLLCIDVTCAITAQKTNA